MIKLPLPSWRGQCVTIPSPLTRSCPVISFNFSEFFLRTRQTLHYRHDDDTKCNERFKNSHNFFVRVFWNVMYLICFTTPQPFALAGDDIVGVCKETTLLVRSVYFFSSSSRVFCVEVCLQQKDALVQPGPLLTDTICFLGRLVLGLNLRLRECVKIRRAARFQWLLMTQCVVFALIRRVVYHSLIPSGFVSLFASWDLRQCLKTKKRENFNQREVHILQTWLEVRVGAAVVETWTFFFLVLFLFLLPFLQFSRASPASPLLPLPFVPQFGIISP